MPDPDLDCVKMVSGDRIVVGRNAALIRAVFA